MKFADIKISPLNLIVAICVTYSIYMFLGFDTTNQEIGNGAKILYTIILAVILFLADILFRRFIENFKWLWLIQGSFILLISVMILIFQKI